MKTLFAIGIVVNTALTLACSPRQKGERTTIVLLGRSSSERISEQPELAMASFRTWLGQVQQTGHGRFEIAVVGRGIDDTPVTFTATYPSRFPAPVSRHRKKWADSVSSALTHTLADLPTGRGSAIVEGLFRAARRMPTGGSDRTVVVIATDLRQVTPGKWNFERSTPEPEVFLEWVDQVGVAPSLSPTTTIVACGFHMDTPDATSKMTAANYGRIERVWQAAFGRWVRTFRIQESCAGADMSGA